MHLRIARMAALAATIIALAPGLAAAKGSREASGTMKASSNATLNVAKSGQLGSILVDSKGMTLYVFEKDGPALTNCYGGCAGIWPPLTVADGDKASVGPGVKGKADVIERTDGTYQVTYNGMPLYTFVKDKKPGDVLGQDVGKDGAKWYVVPPAATSFATAEQLSDQAEQQHSQSAGMSSSPMSSSGSGY